MEINVDKTKVMTNKDRIELEIGQYETLLSKVRKLKWYGHATRSTRLSKTILRGIVRGGRKRGGQRKCCEHNVVVCTN